MTALHTLGISQLEWFSNKPEGVPRGVEYLLAAFPSLFGPTHPKTSQLDLDWMIVEVRSSDEALDHSPSWTNSSYIT